MKLEEITEAWSTVNANQDAILHSGAETHGKAVRARAGPVIGRPGVEDEASTLPKDVRSASCESKERGSHQGRVWCGDSGRHTVETLHRQLWRGMASKACKGDCHSKLKMQLNEVLTKQMLVRDIPSTVNSCCPKAEGKLHAVFESSGMCDKQLHLPQEQD